MLHEVFAEWYSPDDDGLHDIARNGTIAVDTNILTALYKFGAATRNKLLEIFEDEKVRTRLFMPYQVGLEYHQNRLKVARDQHDGYDDLLHQSDSAKGTLRKLISEHAFRDEAVRKDLKSAVDTALTELNQQIETVRDEHVLSYAEVLSSDPIRNSINKIFRERHQIGTPPTDNERATQLKDFEKRYKAEPPIPPGYCDAIGSNKKPNPEGDYLIWCELLGLATTRQDAPLLFVTDDQKEDWYLLGGAKGADIVGPRPELVSEMRDLTDQAYHQTNLSGFLELITTYLAIDLDESTVEEVRRATAVRTASFPMSSGVSIAPGSALQKFNEALATQNVRFMDSFNDVLKQNSIVDYINSQNSGLGRSVLDHLNSESLGVRNSALEAVNSQNLGLQGFYAGLTARDFVTNANSDQESAATESANEADARDLEADADVNDDDSTS